jgi:hypothetical protein
MFGSGQVEAGAKESGELANRLWVEFKKMIGRKYGKSQQSVPYADVATFFKHNKLDTAPLGTNDRMSFSPKDVGNALLQAARTQVMSQYDSGEEQQGQAKPEDQPNQSQGAPTGTPQSTGTGGTDLETQLSSLSDAERNQLLSMLS